MKQMAIYKNEQPFRLITGSDQFLDSNLRASSANETEPLAWRYIDPHVSGFENIPPYDPAEVIQVKVNYGTKSPF